MHHYKHFVVLLVVVVIKVHNVASITHVTELLHHFIATKMPKGWPFSNPSKLPHLLHPTRITVLWEVIDGNSAHGIHVCK